MCLIVSKPKGVPMPDGDKMASWFLAHPDGFGLAFQDKKQIRILKGAMGIEEMFCLIGKMENYLNKVNSTDVDIIFHFRQATGGIITPWNCHPFPLSKNQKRLAGLNVLTACAIAHNGIIYEYSDYLYQDIHFETDKTDTQEFIENHLVNLGKNLWVPAVQQLIANCTSSKFALLSLRGIVYIGAFTEDSGLWFSNDGYMSKPLLPIKTVARQTRNIRDNYISDDWTFNWMPDDWKASCDLCQDVMPLYYATDNDDGVLCWSCYQALYGKMPMEEDRAII